MARHESDMHRRLREARDALTKIVSLLEVAQEFSGAAQNALHIAQRALEDTTCQSN
jgi:hypothetical protein